MYNVLYLIATPLTKVFFLVSKIRRKAVGLSMERVNIESEGSEEAEEESRRFKGNVSWRSFEYFEHFSVYREIPYLIFHTQ